MIDLHIHLLPGLDDGPSSLDETLEMCRLCSEDGVHTLVATPHIIREVYENRRAEILEALEALNRALPVLGLSLQILPGADIRLDYDLIERMDRGELLTINDGNRFLLLEFPDALHAQDYTRVIAALKKRGITTILSHPERNLYFQEYPEALYDLVYSDVLLQITAQSLLGGFGPEIRKFSERLLEHRLIHILASDAHAPLGRSPGLRDAVRRAAECIGEDEARNLVEGNPASILQGALPEVPTPIPWKKARRPWWRFSG
jgi:protein-tyrosine phosphatase